MGVLTGFILSILFNLFRVLVGRSRSFLALLGSGLLYCLTRLDGFNCLLSGCLAADFACCHIICVFFVYTSESQIVKFFFKTVKPTDQRKVPYSFLTFQLSKYGSNSFILLSSSSSLRNFLNEERINDSFLCILTKISLSI
jgi:hypothetical protein